MGTDQLKELKRLQKENERLRKAVSDLTLDKLIPMICASVKRLLRIRLLLHRLGRLYFMVRDFAGGQVRMNMSRRCSR